MKANQTFLLIDYKNDKDLEVEVEAEFSNTSRGYESDEESGGSWNFDYTIDGCYCEGVAVEFPTHLQKQLDLEIEDWQVTLREQYL